MIVRESRRSPLLLGAAVAAAFGLMLSGPAATKAMAQDEIGVVAGSGQLPLVYSGSLPSHFFRRSFSELREFAMPLDPYQQRLITSAVNWTDSLNSLNLGASESLAKLPFFIEGRVVEDREAFRESLRQWYLVHSLDGYRDEQKYPVRHVILYTAENWLKNTVSGINYEELFQQLNIEDGFVVEMILSNPEDGLTAASQQFFMTRDAQPRVAGVWQYLGDQ